MSKLEKAMSKPVRLIIIKYLFCYIIVVFIMPFVDNDTSFASDWKKAFFMFIIWAIICLIEIYFENRKQRKVNK